MSRRRPREITPKKLLSLWLAYTEFRKPQITYSTLTKDYAKIRRILEAKLPPNLTTSIEIRDWVRSTYSAESARRIIQQFNACCEWAFDSDLYPSSPFTGMNRQFRKVTNGVDNYKAFTVEERDVIITRFTELQSYYTPWVKFLFWTGCRPEEASGLRWEHVRPNFSEIHFKVSFRCDVKKEQPTKNKRERWFPCHDRLINLLRSQYPGYRDIALPVFPGAEGGHLEYHNFQTRHWLPIVQELVEEQKVFEYMTQYHCRHTWITLALEEGFSIQDVAYLAGDTPRVIWDHYASRSKVKVKPDF
ncbi:MAG: hypothetical protein B0A82_22625 [Alkalinema sp. CACIAM 70d]|nr:MAG: hypothetical protein B0A82_22625 [Alkalinema sp. CACIAM 70d]